MEASITLKKVGKLIDDKTIVAGLTFGIERGSLVAIIGANDTGKSILLRLLSGYEKPDYGNIFIHGLDMQKRKSKTRQLIGFVPHETDLDPWLTIEQNIRFSSLLYNVNDVDYKNRLELYSNNLADTSELFWKLSLQYFSNIGSSNSIPFNFFMFNDLKKCAWCNPRYFTSII